MLLLLNHSSVISLENMFADDLEKKIYGNLFKLCIDILSYQLQATDGTFFLYRSLSNKMSTALRRRY